MTSRRLLALLLLGACACTGETRVSLLEPELGDAPGGEPDAGAPIRGLYLIHRYSFSGDGSSVVDSIGGLDGTLQNGAVLDGAGHAVLDGKDDYVDLPNRLLSGLNNATLIAWLSWNGGPCWQRVFDFGSNDAAEGEAGNAVSSVFATPLRCPGSGPAAAFQSKQVMLGSVDSDSPFPVLQNTSLAVVLDAASQSMTLYVAGKSLGSGTFTALSELSDVNDWLGRSQWAQDAALRGSFDELRIYDRALDADAVAALDAAGPDALP